MTANQSNASLTQSNLAQCVHHIGLYCIKADTQVAMPTIYREQGFQFFVYPNDHQPAHVHVFHADGEVKIDISGSEPLPISVYGKMKLKIVKKALDIAEVQLKELQSGWEEFHGSLK